MQLLDMHTIKPLYGDAVMQCARETKVIVTVEDHSIINGLGSAVAETVAAVGGCPVRRIGIRDCFGESAPYERLLAKNGITVEHILCEARDLVH